jgi:transcriptional regulator with XRE-family HTH domain
MDQDIGARLRAIRQHLRLSQRQLARQSGVANATISQVEAGKLNPTVSMLKKILDGVPLSLGEFFADDLQAHRSAGA